MISLSLVSTTPLKNDRLWQRHLWLIFRWYLQHPGEQLSPVTMTPVITFFPGVVDTGQDYPQSLKFIAGVNDTIQKLFTGVNDTAGKFFAGVNDTDNKTLLTIPACLDLKFKNKPKIQSTRVKCPYRTLRGPRGHWFMKKTWSSKSLVRLPLKVLKFGLWRTTSVCYVTLSLTPSGLNLCQIVKTVYKT